MAEQTTVAVEGGLRTAAERDEALKNRTCFERNPSSWESKMENFPKYVRRQNITRFLALYEVFKLALPIKGSIVECGVHQGFGVMSWAKLSATLEPINLTRKIYGFDTFSGFPGVGEKDRSVASEHVRAGDLFADSSDEIAELAAIHDSTRFLGHIPKVSLIKGDACLTIPRFIEKMPHVLVSLLFLDFDLYEPTRVALQCFLPRMPKGAIVAFDELDNPLWPGETLAALEVLDKYKLRIQRLAFDPYIGFAEVG
jgi:hypothetical protein